MMAGAAFESDDGEHTEPYPNLIRLQFVYKVESEDLTDVPKDRQSRGLQVSGA